MPASNLESHRKAHSDHPACASFIVRPSAHHSFPPTPQELTPPDFPFLGCWHVPQLINPGPGTCVDLSPSQVGPSSGQRIVRSSYLGGTFRHKSGFSLCAMHLAGSIITSYRVFWEERLPVGTVATSPTMSNLESRRSSRVLNLNPMPFSPSICPPVILSVSTQRPAIHP